VLDRMQLGDVPRKHHVQLRGPGGELRYEECFTRDGFDGPYTILYHLRRPHTQRLAKVPHGWAKPEATPERALAKRHYKTGDVKKGHFEGSGLKSTVMWDPHSGLKFANNEPQRPFFKASQINIFNEELRGDGVQHVAMTVRDILTAVRELRGNGVTFMPTPGTYYDMLPERIAQSGVGKIDEDIEVLRELEVLLDGDHFYEYMLQIFLKESAGLYNDPKAGPFFYEIIQRKGDPGFGGGNFRALFESIEREQLGAAGSA